MKEDPRELFSLYLDNQAGPKERRQVEEIVKRDPEARRELESLREFSGMIDDAAPPRIQPPPGFREKIIHKLRANGTGTGGGGIGKLLHLKASQYWLTGAVLISLIGSLVYLDGKRNQAENISQAAGQEELSLELPEAGLVHDRPEFQGMFTELPGESLGVDLDDIQTVSDYTINQPAGFSGPSSPEGEVYVSGRGKAAKSSRFKGKAAGPSAGEVFLPVEPVRVTLKLESQDNWSLQSIAQAYQAQGVQTVAAPAEILRLARQNNLNPGLLVAATLMATDYDLPEISRRLRDGLNASFGRPENDRLLSLITALEGSETWLPRWRSILKETGE